MICKRCEEDKPESEFYKNDKTCKVCRRAMVKANREAKADYYREYDRKRSNNESRVAARERYRKTPQGKAAHNAATKRWSEKNSLKRSAHIQVANAIRDGKLIRSGCEICGDLDSEAHHDDYSNPLNVRWLCKKHHDQWHRENVASC